MRSLNVGRGPAGQSAQVTVNFAVSTGTARRNNALAGSDFAVNMGGVTFGVGESVKTFDVFNAHSVSTRHLSVSDISRT